MVTVKELIKHLKACDADTVVIGMSEDDGRRAAWVDLKCISKKDVRRIKSKDHDGDEFVEYVQKKEGKKFRSCIKLCF